jgi:hypothetical protein
MIWRNIFINPERQTLRSGWRVAVFFLIFAAVFVLLSRLLAGILHLLGDRIDVVESSTLSGQFISYAILIASILIASAVCLRFFDGRKLRSIGYQFHPGWWRDYLIGTVIATVMMTVIVGVEYTTGSVSLRWSDTTASDTAEGLLVTFVFFNVAAAFEELLFRGYPLQTLLRDLHPAVAIAIPSVLFGLGHIWNPDPSALAIINTIIAGVWLSVAYLKTRSLWLCTSLHYAWNWTMNSIYGLNVSGIQTVSRDASSLLQATQAGPDWLTGGSYGPEGGALATLMIGVATIGLWQAKWLAPSQEVIETLQPTTKSPMEIDLKSHESPNVR